MSQASATPEYEYDQNVVAMAEVPTLSPRSALATQPVVYPLATLLAMPTAQLTPPEIEAPPKRHAIPQA